MAVGGQLVYHIHLECSLSVYFILSICIVLSKFICIFLSIFIFFIYFYLFIYLFYTPIFELDPKQPYLSHADKKTLSIRKVEALIWIFMVRQYYCYYFIIIYVIDLILFWPQEIFFWLWPGFVFCFLGLVDCPLIFCL